MAKGNLSVPKMLRNLGGGCCFLPIHPRRALFPPLPLASSTLGEESTVLNPMMGSKPDESKVEADEGHGLSAGEDVDAFSFFEGTDVQKTFSRLLPAS
ncbi:hypothetical protein ACG7TL_008109 [Trametes sanguinea]